MSTGVNDGTNVTRPSDLVKSTSDLRFLSINETSYFWGVNPTATTIGRSSFETGAEVFEDLQGHLSMSCSLLDRDDI
jgi:hypothetical protein